MCNVYYINRTIYYIMQTKIEIYKNIADSLRETLNLNNTNNSYTYIEPVQTSLEGFIQALLNKGLITTNQSLEICDIGFGLGTSLFNLKTQVDCFSFTNVHYTGIEHNKNLLVLFNQILKNKWVNLTLKEDDLFNINYNSYDIIYMYSPLRDKKLILKGYEKIISEMKSGSVLYERFNFGRGVDSLLYSLCQSTDVKIEPIYFNNTKNYIICK